MLGDCVLHTAHSHSEFCLRVRREMDFLEVYRAEGWRGANKDKLKPSAEIQRAELQVSCLLRTQLSSLQACACRNDYLIPAD